MPTPRRSAASRADATGCHASAPPSEGTSKPASGATTWLFRTPRTQQPTSRRRRVRSMPCSVQSALAEEQRCRASHPPVVEPGRPKIRRAPGRTSADVFLTLPLRLSPWSPKAMMTHCASPPCRPHRPQRSPRRSACLVGPYVQAVKAVSGCIARVRSSGSCHRHHGWRRRCGSGNPSGAQKPQRSDGSRADASRVVRTTVFLADLNDFQKVNALYAGMFGEGVSPARACVQVAALPLGAKVEIDCVAYLG